MVNDPAQAYSQQHFQSNMIRSHGPFKFKINKPFHIHLNHFIKTGSRCTPQSFTK